MNKLLTTTIALVMGMTIATGAQAVVPDVIPVQGVLADSDAAPIDGLVDMTFTLYDAETAGTVLWTDSFTDVDVDMGFFTVYLGSGTALEFYTLLTNDEIWLGVTIESDPEMNRFPFYTVPFAIEALVCERVGNLTETDINNNFLPSSYTPSWTDLTDVPAGFADGTDDGFTTEAELTTLLDDNYLPSSYVPSWEDLTDMPSGFADDVDDMGFTTEAELVALLDDNYAALGHDHDADYDATPAGTVSMFAGSTAPAGYLLCDGSEVSRATYADLFAAIGTTFGVGDGSTTFNLPDLQGQVVVGRDPGEPAFDTMAEVGGEMAHTLTTAEMPGHTHTGSASSAGDHSHTGTAASAGGHGHTASSGSGGGHNHTATTTTASAHSHSVSLYGALDYNYTYTPDTYAWPYVRDASTWNYGDGWYDELRFYDGAAYHQPTDMDWVELAHADNVTSGTGGSHNHTLTTSTASSHTHTISVTAVADHSHTTSTNTTGAHTHTVTNGSTGGDTAHNVVQPYVVMNYIIKT